MEPGPLLEEEFVSDPAAKPDAIANEHSQPYLKLRTLVEVPADDGASQNASETPMPDLTDFAIPESPLADLTPLVSVIEPESPPTSRVALSRSWLVGLGVLAFAAGLLTAVGARVFATTNAKVAAPVETRPAVAVAVAPVAVAPVTVVPVTAPSPAPAAAVPAIPTTPPEVASAPPGVPVIAQPIARAPLTSNGGPAAPAGQRVRGRAARARGPARAHVRTSAETGDESAAAKPEERPAAPEHGAPGWVDPFAE